MTPNELKIMETGLVENDSINIELNEFIKAKYGLNIVYSYYMLEQYEAVIYIYTETEADIDARKELILYYGDLKESYVMIIYFAELLKNNGKKELIHPLTKLKLSSLERLATEYCCMKAYEAVISDESISKEDKIKLLIESFDIARNYDKLNLLTRNNYEAYIKKEVR